MKTNTTENVADQLPSDLTNLINAIDKLPQEYKDQLSLPLTRVVEYTRRRRRILDLIQDALGQLRLDMKYLMFDLEATRRERDAYRNGTQSDESAE
jgi:hypothetical protein